MATTPLRTLAISEFKATCLAVLEEVRRTGMPVQVTKRGVPIAEIVPPSPAASGAEWLGALRGSAHFVGDVVAPVMEEATWEALATDDLTAG